MNGASLKMPSTPMLIGSSAWAAGAAAGGAAAPGAATAGGGVLGAPLASSASVAVRIPSARSIIIASSSSGCLGGCLAGCLASGAHRHPAVRIDHLSRDVRGVVRDQERMHRRDLLRPREALQGNATQHLLADLL